MILAATGAEAAIQETRRTLAVTATVTDACTVSTARPASCTTGTSWTRSTAPWPAAGPAQQPEAARVEAVATYITITY